MSRYDAVLFDMDGVLIEGAATPASVYEAAADDALAALDVTVDADSRTPFRQYHYDERMAGACREVGLDPATFWQTRERFATERANDRLADGARPPFPDTSALPDLPVPLGIVSNNRTATVEFVAEHLIDARFEVALGRDPTPDGFTRRKPDSFYLDRALERMGVESALYVGDRETDIVAARSAGIDSAFIRRDHNADLRFDRPPALDVDSLVELRRQLTDD